MNDVRWTRGECKWEGIHIQITYYTSSLSAPLLGKTPDIHKIMSTSQAFPPSSFWSLAGRGNAWSTLSHDTWVDRGGEGSSIERMSLRPYLVVSGSSAGVGNICEAQNVPLLVQKKNAYVRCILSIGTPPSSVYLGRHWRHSCHTMDQAFPIHFCTLQAIKNWMVGKPGNEATRHVISVPRPSMFFVALLLPCIILNANPKTKQRRPGNEATRN